MPLPGDVAWLGASFEDESFCAVLGFIMRRAAACADERHDTSNSSIDLGYRLQL